MNAVTTTRNTNSIFDTKEQYVAFRAKWKQLHADGLHNRVRRDYDGGSVWDSASRKYVPTPGGFRMESPLTVWHHLIFNLAIGRNPPVSAFGERQPERWLKSALYWNLKYANWDFTLFGDSLTDAQKDRLKRLAQGYIDTL